MVDKMEVVKKSAPVSRLYAHTILDTKDEQVSVFE